MEILIGLIMAVTSFLIGGFIGGVIAVSIGFNFLAGFIIGGIVGFNAMIAIVSLIGRNE
jgi:hypothetical protein